MYIGQVHFFSRLDEGEYMGFGLSGDNERTKMIGGDVTVAWMDHGSGMRIINPNGYVKYYQHFG